jgi:hypothetical protein
MEDERYLDKAYWTGCGSELRMYYIYLIVNLFLSLFNPLRILFSLTRSFTSENSLHFEINSTYNNMASVIRNTLDSFSYKILSAWI